jgi:flagellar protein FlbD
VLKLTRLNRHPVAVNPDHISWIDEAPDTTLCLISGDKLIVRETIDELIEQLIAYRRLLRADSPGAHAAGEGPEIDLPPVEFTRDLRHTTHSRGGSSSPPISLRGGSSSPPISLRGGDLLRGGEK